MKQVMVTQAFLLKTNLKENRKYKFLMQPRSKPQNERLLTGNQKNDILRSVMEFHNINPAIT
jgi:hypothetical protein